MWWYIHVIAAERSLFKITPLALFLSTHSLRLWTVSLCVRSLLISFLLTFRVCRYKTSTPGTDKALLLAFADAYDLFFEKGIFARILYGSFG